MDGTIPRNLSDEDVKQFWVGMYTTVPQNAFLTAYRMLDTRLFGKLSLLGKAEGPDDYGNSHISQEAEKAAMALTQKVLEERVLHPHRRQ